MMCFEHVAVLQPCPLANLSKWTRKALARTLISKVYIRANECQYLIVKVVLVDVLAVIADSLAQKAATLSWSGAAAAAVVTAQPPPRASGQQVG